MSNKTEKEAALNQLFKWFAETEEKNAAIDQLLLWFDEKEKQAENKPA